MDEINDNILKINCLDYNEQCLCIANKLLSYNPIDITRTIFFKKLYVILKRLLEISKKFDDKIGEKVEIFSNFWPDFEDNTYFYDNRGYIRLKYVKLTKDDYILWIPTKFESTVILHINTMYKNEINREYYKCYKYSYIFVYSLKMKSLLK